MIYEFKYTSGFRLHDEHFCIFEKNWGRKSEGKGRKSAGKGRKKPVCIFEPSRNDRLQALVKKACFCSNLSDSSDGFGFAIQVVFI